MLIVFLSFPRDCAQRICVHWKYCQRSKFYKTFWIASVKGLHILGSLCIFSTCHSLYLSDFNLLNYFLCPKLKIEFEGDLFATIETIQEDSCDREVQSNTFPKQIPHKPWKKCWGSAQKCVYNLIVITLNTIFAWNSY